MPHKCQGTRKHQFPLFVMRRMLDLTQLPTWQNPPAHGVLHPHRKMLASLPGFRWMTGNSFSATPPCSLKWQARLLLRLTLSHPIDDLGICTPGGWIMLCKLKQINTQELAQGSEAHCILTLLYAATRAQTA